MTSLATPLTRLDRQGKKTNCKYLLKTFLRKQNAQNPKKVDFRLYPKQPVLHSHNFFYEYVLCVRDFNSTSKRWRRVSEMTKHQPDFYNKKSKRYVSELCIIAVFYLIPAIQLVWNHKDVKKNTIKNSNEEKNSDNTNKLIRTLISNDVKRYKAIRFSFTMT